MKTFLNILWDILAAPFRVVMDPWAAMHGNIGAGLGRLSMAGIAAVLTFLFLLLIVVLFTILFRFQNVQIDWFDYQRVVPVVGLLVIVIPVVVYFMVRYWTEEISERFPDIEQAWNLGIQELRRQGFDLARTPLYLVVGSESSLKDQYLFQASELKFIVTHFPRGRGLALRWYASEDALFVVLSHIGCLTALSRTAAALTTNERVQISYAAAAAGGPSSVVGPTATVWPAENESELADSGIRKAPSAVRRSSNQVSPAMTLGVDDSSVVPSGGADSAAESKSRPKLQPLSREMFALEQRRLVYLCRLARETRRPYCPINGALVQIPLNLIVTDDSEGAYAKEALAADVSTLMAELSLRFPILALVTGWDDDIGFLEFMRRFEPEVVRNHRLGKGFGVGDPPLTDQLDALCIHASRQFEDWIYKFFRRPAALMKPGNRQLYSLLCKVRRYLVPRLKKIVSDALGCREMEDQENAPIVVGAYFVAAGAHEDHRAFAKGVFGKLIETNEDLEWTPQAQRANARYYTFGYTCLAFAVVCFAAAILLSVALWKGA